MVLGLRISIFKVLEGLNLDPGFKFLLKTKIAVKSRRNAQTKKVRVLLRVFDVE